MTTRLVTQEVTKSPTRLAAGLPIPLLLMPLETDLRLLRGTGSATLTRSTIGTFEDKDDGLVKTAAIDVARFEQNGILMEGASENLLLRVEEFDNASWNKSGTTVVTANATTAPDGATTAEKIETTTAFHNVNQVSTVVSGSDHTLSVYPKKNTVPTVSMTFISGANDVRRVFNIDTNAITVGAGENGSGFVSDSIENLANLWNRIKLTVTSAATSVTSIIYPDDLANGTLNSSFFFGGQLEALSFASSYIKTVGSTVTRTADNLNIDAANIPAPTADYTISMEVDAIGFDSSLSQVLFNVAGETSRRIAWNTTTGAIEATHGAVTSVSTSTFVAGDRVKISFAVDGTNQTLYINGIQEDQDAKGTVTGTATAINIGHQAGVNQAFSHTQSLRIDNVALTASQAGAI